MAERSVDERCVMVYDPELMAPACVLLQAAFGCGRPAALKFFDSRRWLVSPTSGMRKVIASMEEWKQLARLTEGKWKNAKSKAQRHD